MAKMIGSLAIVLTISWLERAGRRQPEEHVRAFHRLGQGPLVGVDRVRQFPLVEIGAAL